MDKDLEHLKILSICYYISAGIIALFSCFPLIYAAMGIVIVSVDLPQKSSEPPAALIGGIFIAFGLIASLCGWAIAVGSFFAGKYLKEKKNYIFCMVLAAINCLFFPIGMTLGIFTFIVLARDSVKMLFNQNARVAENPAPFNNSPDWRQQS